MTPDVSERDRFTAAVRKLEQLRRFAGSAAEFWQTYLDAIAGLTGAAVVTILRRREGDVAEWRRVAVWPAVAPGSEPRGGREFWGRVEEAANAAATEGQAQLTLPSSAARLPHRIAAVRLETDRDTERWIALVLVQAVDEVAASEAQRRLLFINYVPAHFQLRRVALHLQAGEGGAVSVLDLVAMLNRSQRFVEAALLFCNEIAARHRCERVSLGWEERGMMCTRAMSHTDKFVRKMEAVQRMESAMEECLDQDEPIAWPPAAGETQVTRDHRKLAEGQERGFLCSFPLRLNDQPVGVVLCERAQEAFEEEEVRDLMICADLNAPRLAELHRRDRWFGARWAESARTASSKLVGPRHTWAKLGAVAGTVALASLFVVQPTYRVEAPFTLRPQNVSLLSAPFDGFIFNVKVEAGDAVQVGDPLLEFDTRDLLLEEAGALADCDRFRSEEEKDRANGALADMRIAQAQLAQAKARLDLVRHRLSLATLTSPYDGFVVEGDLKERIGAPVRRGDVLFRVSRLDAAYIECRVDERDIQDLQPGARGQIAFASRPKTKFPLEVVLVEPVAVEESAGNVYVVRCKLSGADPEAWWRPGMTGLSKIEAGQRTLFSIIFRRTIDKLRLWLWW
jgi:multidrug resistance efflux pump